MKHFPHPALLSVLLGTLTLLGIPPQHAEATPAKPSISVRVLKESSIEVRASDRDGLDLLEISCPEADQTYTLQLSRSEVAKSFQQTFKPFELFALKRNADRKDAVKLIVSVRNTRGRTESAPAEIR